MKRTIGIVVAFIAAVGMFWSGILMIGAIAVVSVDTYHGVIPSRPHAYTPELVRQSAVMYGVIYVATLVIMLIAVAYAASHENKSK